MCYVSENYASESNDPKQYRLPDNSRINVSGTFCKQVPELFFKPNLNFKKCKAIQSMAYKSSMESDADLRRELLSNIVLSGGSMMFAGMAERINMEVSNLIPTGGP